MDDCDGYEVTVYAAGVTEPVYWRPDLADITDVVRLLRTARAMAAPHVIAKIEIVPWWHAGRAPRPGLMERPAAATRPVLLPANPVHRPYEVCDCPNPRPGRPWHCAATGDA